ncbi:hypothetical protein FXO38_12053, partial [Capsicum annuum]
MDSVFSVDDIADQLWSSPPPMRLSHDLDSSTSATSSSKMMNRSSSEWAFQRFLEEADTTSQQIKDHNLIADQSEPMSNTASFASEPPSNIPIDSDEYQAFLKRRLDLACAVFALTRANYVRSQDSASLPPEKGSLAANASVSASQVPPREKKGSPVHKVTAMRGVRGRAPPQGCIVRSLTLHFCQRLFPRLEPLTSWSYDNNFTSYSKAPLHFTSLENLEIQENYRPKIMELLNLPLHGGTLTWFRGTLNQYA